MAVMNNIFTDAAPSLAYIITSFDDCLITNATLAFDAVVADYMVHARSQLLFSRLPAAIACSQRNQPFTDVVRLTNAAVPSPGWFTCMYSIPMPPLTECALASAR